MSCWFVAVNYISYNIWLSKNAFKFTLLQLTFKLTDIGNF